MVSMSVTLWFFFVPTLLIPRPLRCMNGTALTDTHRKWFSLEWTVTTHHIKHTNTRLKHGGDQELLI